MLHYNRKVKTLLLIFIRAAGRRHTLYYIRQIAIGSPALSNQYTGVIILTYEHRLYVQDKICALHDLSGIFNHFRTLSIRKFELDEN